LREYPYSEAFPAKMSLLGAAMKVSRWRGFPFADMFFLSGAKDAAAVDEANGEPRRSASKVEGVNGAGHSPW
jgi:hypothetical protein